MSLQEMIKAFLREVCAGKVNETPQAYRSKLGHLERYLGSERDSISQEDIDDFKIYLLNRKTKRRGAKTIKEPLSKFTIRSILATTRHFLKWAYHKKHLPDLIECPNIPEPEADPKPISQETLEKLLSAVPECGPEWEQARNRAILYVLRDTGGRVGAILRIETDSMELGHGRATVRDKKDKLTTLRFNPQTITAIRTWLKVRDTLNPTDYRLFSGSGGSGLTRTGFYKVLERLTEIANVHDRHNPHSFRHAFARDSLEAGADLSQVSQLMAHSSVVVTHKFYLRWSKNELDTFHTKFSPGRLLPPVKGKLR